MKRLKVRVHTFYGEIAPACTRCPDGLWWLGSPPGSLWIWIEWLEDFESCSMIKHDTSCNSGQRSWKWGLEVFWIMKMHLDLLYMMLRWGLNDWFVEILQGEGVSSLRLKMLKVGEIERKSIKLVCVWALVWFVKRFGPLFIARSMEASWWGRIFKHLDQFDKNSLFEI